MWVVYGAVGAAGAGVGGFRVVWACGISGRPSEYEKEEYRYLAARYEATLVG